VEPGEIPQPPPKLERVRSDRYDDRNQIRRHHSEEWSTSNTPRDSYSRQDSVGRHPDAYNAYPPPLSRTSSASRERDDYADPYYNGGNRGYYDPGYDHYGYDRSTGFPPAGDRGYYDRGYEQDYSRRSSYSGGAYDGAVPPTDREYYRYDSRPGDYPPDSGSSYYRSASDRSIPSRTGSGRDNEGAGSSQYGGTQQSSSSSSRKPSGSGLRTPR
jgi:hypothetical protein